MNWKALAYFFEIREIEFSINYMFTVLAMGNNRTPGINNERITIVPVPQGVFTMLIGGNDIDLIFDGTCPHQCFPVGFSCCEGKG